MSVCLYSYYSSSGNVLYQFEKHETGSQSLERHVNAACELEIVNITPLKK